MTEEDDAGREEGARNSDERIRRRNSESETDDNPPSEDVGTGDEKGSKTRDSEEDADSRKPSDSRELANHSSPTDEADSKTLDDPIPQFAIDQPTGHDEKSLEDTVDVESDLVQLPQIELQNTVEFHQPNLEDSFESAFEKEVPIRIPQIEFESLVEIEVKELDSVLVKEFEETIPEVPRFRPEVPPEPQSYTPLLKKPPVEYEPANEREYNEQDEVATKTNTTAEDTRPTSEVTEKTSSGGRSIHDEWPDPKELLLGRRGSDITAREPIVVCIDDQAGDDFVEVLETLIVRLYREKIGGNPTPTRLTTAEGLLEEERWIEAEDNIFTVKLNKSEWDELKNEDWERIWNDRVQNQLYAQSFGAIILNTIPVTSPQAHYPKKLDLKLTTLPPDVQDELIRLFWGCFVQMKEEDDFTFGQRFNQHGERIVERYWGEIEGAEGGLFWDATTPDESAGHHHRRMKVLVVKWLTERLRESSGKDLESPIDIKNEIMTEQKIPPEQKESPKADVICDNLSESPKGVFEIETLFKEDAGSKKPRDKLSESFEKYEKEENVDEINIVLDNLATMLHLRTLGKLRIEDWEKAYGKEVNFYTLNLEDQEIVPIETIVRKVQNLEDVIDFSDPSLP